MRVCVRVRVRVLARALVCSRRLRVRIPFLCVCVCVCVCSCRPLARAVAKFGLAWVCWVLRQPHQRLAMAPRGTLTCAGVAGAAGVTRAKPTDRAVPFAVRDLARGVPLRCDPGPGRDVPRLERDPAAQRAVVRPLFRLPRADVRNVHIVCTRAAEDHLDHTPLHRHRLGLSPVCPWLAVAGFAPPGTAGLCVRSGATT